MKLTKIVKAWIAGFWEGEGSAGSYRYKTTSRWTGKPSYVRQSLTVQISQKSKFPLNYIKKFYGGYLGRYHSSSFTKELHYKWGICSKPARRFLKDILPFIRTPKRRNIILKALWNDKKWIDRKHHNATK